MKASDPSTRKFPDREWFLRAVVLFSFVCLGAHGASPGGSRLSASDIVVVVPGLQALTFVPVSPGFDYAVCAAFPRPMDLRCDLFAQGGFDAEGRQYALRFTDSDAGAVLARTEIWRASIDGEAELVASLDPRPNEVGAYDDGRMERIAVDLVHGCIYVVLATTCYPPEPDSCAYAGRTVEIVRIVGLRSLADVLAEPEDPLPAGSGSGVSRPTILTHPGGADDETAPRGGIR